MEALFTGTWLADVAIAVLLLEWLLLRWRGRGDGRAPTGMTGMTANLLAGLFLLLALRAALAATVWPWLPLALTGALLAHLWDLRQRLRS